jgi:hypothetical protein
VPSEARARALGRVIVEHGGGALWLLADLGLVRARGALGPIFAAADAVHGTPRTATVAYSGALAGSTDGGRS